MPEKEKKRIDPAVILLSAVSVLSFLLFYFSDFLRPGGAYKLGWYETWADQGAYLDMVNGMRHGGLGDFNYPVLYPFFGFLGSFITKADPFVLVNLACFVAVIILSFKVFVKYFDRQLSLLASVTLVMLLTGMFTVPWTTTLTSLCFMYVFYVFAYGKYELFPAILAGICVGSAFAARFGDVLPVGAAFAVYSFIGIKDKKNLKPLIYGLSVAALIIAVDLLINYDFSGRFFGNYFASISGSGFNFEGIPYKFYGYVVDSLAFHRENHPFAVPLLRYAFVFSIAPLGLILLLKEKTLRAETIFSAFVLICWCVIYLPFVAVTGFTLKNFSLHYSKMLFPLLMFLSLFAIKLGLSERRNAGKLILFYFAAVALVTIVFVKEFKFVQINLAEIAVASGNAASGSEMSVNTEAWKGWAGKGIQAPGMECVLELKKEKMINRIILESRGTEMKYPEEIGVYIRSGGNEWKKIKIIGFFSKGEVFDMLFEAVNIKAVKFVIEKEKPGKKWIINNFYAFVRKH